MGVGQRMPMSYRGSEETGMLTFQLRRNASYLRAGLLCGPAMRAGASSADAKDDAAAKPTPSVKTEAPAPISARERMLLDRLEELEKRVAELEAKAPPVAAAPAAGLATEV